MSKIFYIADLHFGHKNILKYDNRPFFGVNEMNNTLIAFWNSVVKKEDIVYVLGDVSWYNKEGQKEIVNQLNGKKILVYGNHDYEVYSDDGFAEHHDYLEISDNGRKVVLSHYPIASFNGMYRGWYHLYGHVHNQADDNMIEHYFKEWENYYLKPCYAANVGAMKDWMDYTPRTLDEIIKAKGW